MHSSPVRPSISDNSRYSLPNGFDQQLQVLQRRLGQHPVPEVEDMPAAAAGSPQHVARPLPNQLRRAEQDRRLQVALDRTVLADPDPAPVDRPPPVAADSVRP